MMLVYRAVYVLLLSLLYVLHVGGIIKFRPSKQTNQYDSDIPDGAGGSSMGVSVPFILPAGTLGEEITFPLPGSAEELVCVVESAVDHPDSASRSFLGQLGSVVDSAGSCAVTCGMVTTENGRRLSCLGNIRPNGMTGHQLELRPVSGGLFHSLTRVPLHPYADITVDSSHESRRMSRSAAVDLYERGGGGGGGPQQLRAGEEASAAVVNENDILDVMVVYTQLAEAHLGSADAVKLFMNHAFDEANDILARSRVGLRLRAVHVGRMQNTAYSDPNNMARTLDQATYFGGSNAEFDTEQAYRATIQADALVIVTRPQSPTLCGIAWLNKGALSASSMVSVVDLTCAVGYYAFIHELAHNLGAAHDRSVAAASEGAFSYAHGWCWDVAGAAGCDGSCRRSLMSYPSCSSAAHACTGCKPYPYFSNPDVFESGSSTGRGADNNALTLNNRKASAVTLATSLQSGGLIFSVNPNHKMVNLSCFTVVIYGWRIGGGDDITQITVAGVPSVSILAQGPDHVAFTVNSSWAAPSTGDVVVHRSGGSDTVLSDAFTFDPALNHYNVTENFEDGVTPFFLSGEGAFFYLDAACPTGAGQICESYGPAAGKGVFVMVRPDSGGRKTGITANFSSYPNCQDTVSSISVEYYAYSLYDNCYEAGFLKIQVKYAASGGWKTVATADQRQNSNSEAWLTLSTKTSFAPAVVYGVRIVADSYSPTFQCSYWNPVALDNIIVQYSTHCLNECTAFAHDVRESSTSNGFEAPILIIALGVAGLLFSAIVYGFWKIFGIFGKNLSPPIVPEGPITMSGR